MQTQPLDPGKLYLRFFHGRNAVDEKLDDWGFDGPTIGPLEYVHVTYMCDVKFSATPEVMDRFFPDIMAEWRSKGYSNAAGPLCDWQFKSANDLIEYQGKYYGDWTVFVADPEPDQPDDSEGTVRAIVPIVATIEADPGKVYLTQGEHWRVPGTPTKIYATRAGAVAKAVELINTMLADSGEPADANLENWEQKLAMLQDKHGAAHCWVEITAHDVAV